MIRDKKTLVALSSALLFVGCALNPITGHKEFMLFGPDQDVAIGNRYAPELEKQMGGRISDSTVQNYIDSVGQKLARASQMPDLDYHFIAVDHESINAFALPGGHIFITRGMLEALDSESQLAAILGHEIAHVVARDTAAAMSREIGVSILLTAVAAGVDSGGVMTVADVTRQILGLRYSRQDEHEADIAGLDYMVKGGYDPTGMADTMQVLEEHAEGNVPEFFSTHPSPANRKQYISERIQTRYRGALGRRRGSSDYRTYVLERLTG